MGQKSRMHLELHVGSLAMPARRLHGVEDVSVPFCFEVEAAPAGIEPLELAPLLGQDAKVCLRRSNGDERWVNGICTYADLTGVEAGNPVYLFTVEPKLLLLDRRQDCRVFQDQTAPEIVEALLNEAGVSHRLALSGTYPKRDLCLQYRETTLAFVSRLLEDEGIAYWFEHSIDEHVMVLGDDPASFQPLPGGEQVPHREDSGLRFDEPHLYALRYTEELRQAQVTIRGFEFERPLAPVGADASDGTGPEVYDYPAGGYPHAQSKRLSKTRLEELRTGRRAWRGEGTWERLTPGHVMEVTDHGDPSFNNRLALLHVEHDAVSQAAVGDVAQLQDGYRNRFQAIDAGSPFRPARRTPRPVIGGPQTATVVGPAGEEVHLDANGRVMVKVQFHWDRKGRNDASSSAWIRLAQAWGGPGYGALFVPRIGQEVLVRFLDGNPDRPMVTGALFNGTNTLPIQLPDDRTRSTLRTDSSLGGGGWNEIRFEDLKGQEQLHTHAQKDETIEVRRDKRQHVRHDEQLQVDQDRAQRVNGAQTLLVKGNEETTIEGSRSATITEDRDVRVFASHEEEIGRDHGAQVGASRSVVVFQTSDETIGAASTLNVGGAYAVQVAAEHSETVATDKRVTVGGNRRETVGKDRSESVSGDARARVGGAFQSDARKDVTLKVEQDLGEDVSGGTGMQAGAGLEWRGKGFKLQADKLVLVVGGKKILTMASSGAVQLAGTDIGVSGQAVSLSASSISKSGPAGPSSGSASVKKLDPLPADRASLEIELVDDHGEPLANEPFRVEFPDGKVREGRLDGSGRASVPGAKGGSCKVTFPRLDRNAWKKG